MQAAGMLRGTGAAALSVYVLASTLLAFVGDNAHAHPLQVLPNIPGYIPVYIRLGDQPLQDINPALAEAFHEKKVLESTPPEHLDRSSGNSHSSDSRPAPFEDEDDGLDTGSRKNDTIYLIGVRQPSGGKSKSGTQSAPKIALPFAPLERETGKVAEGQDHGGLEDDWIPPKRWPIGLSGPAVIKTDDLPFAVIELEDEVKSEETRPNDLYDSPIANDRDESAHRVESHIGKVSARRPVPKESGIEDTREKTLPERNTDEDDLKEDTGVRAAEDPEEFRSSRSMSSESRLRPARDPKESRPSDDETDFMESEE